MSTITGDDSDTTGTFPPPSTAGINQIRAYFTDLFKAKTGLNPLSFWSHDNDFVDSHKQLTSTGGQGFFPSSTNGATAAYIAGGISGAVQMLSGVTGAGYCDWSLSQGGSILHIPNLRTKRWMAAYKIAIGTAPSAGSRVAMGAYGSPDMVGLGFGDDDTTWHYCRANNDVVDVFDTGKAIDSSGSVYLWMYIFNDGTHVRVCVDVEGGGIEQIADVSSNLPNIAGYFYGWNHGDATGDAVNFDAYVVMCER